MPATIKHVKGSELPKRVMSQFHILPEQMYTITIDVTKEERERRSRRLIELFEVEPGGFDSPNEIDDFIRKERDSWE